MKEQIYTIPIGEAYALSDGCPMCRLFRKLEEETLAYTLSPAMMEPDVRTTMNAKGFCPEHMQVLLQKQNRLSLALVLESRLDTLRRMPAEKLAAAADSCFVCERANGFMDKCAENILYLWETQEEFREVMLTRRHCLGHIAALLKLGQTELRRKVYAQFAAQMEEQAKRETEALLQSVSRFAKSFDHRFSGQDLGDDKQAVEAACAWMAGGFSGRGVK